MTVAGSSLTFGAKAVGLLCERIEMSVRAGNIDEAKQLLPELEELFSDVCLLPFSLVSFLCVSCSLLVR